MNGRPAIAYVFAKNAIEIPYPQDDILFVQEDVYTWSILDEVAASAYYAGKPHVGYSACKKLLEDNMVPEGEARDRVAKNFEEYEKVLSSIHADEFKNNIDHELEKIKKEKINIEEKLEKKKNRGVKKSTKTASPKGKKKTVKSR
tara:strand:- start:59 stop:493 length:435 start_codon:yes stop_codon:yes gene_type:complete